MRAKEISVTNLFGMFNHQILLKLEDRITIIHGPNGFGKTVLLRMIDGLFKGNFLIFRQIPFNEFRIEFDNGKTITVKQSTQKGHNERFKIIISGPDPDDKPFSPESIEPRHLDFPLAMIDDIVPNLRRIEPDLWRDMRTGQVLSLTEVLMKYEDILPIRPQFRQQPKWLKDIQHNVNTHFVQTNRLIRQALISIPRARTSRRFESEIETMSTAVQYSHELAEKIQQTLAKSAELSQSLDRTFPTRLVKQLSRGKKGGLTSTKLQTNLRELEDKRERLMAAGLMEQDDTNVQIPEQAVVDEPTRTVLSIYIKDVEKKLMVFDEILEKIQLLQKIINDRFLYKKMRISKRDGFLFKTSDDSPLAPDSLSSGEQHELVLFYELLFRIRPDSLILIDEPELSLHIEWQQQFLKDLKAITQLANFDVVIATHSADIIFDRWDLTVELKGPEV